MSNVAGTAAEQERAAEADIITASERQKKRLGIARLLRSPAAGTNQALRAP